jgi:hypothetical protein
MSEGFESLNTTQSSLPIEVNYVRFQALTATILRFRIVFWDAHIPDDGDSTYL